MEKKEVRIEVDELDHATFTYEFWENQGTKTGLSNVANVTHSMDAYVLRSMHRRCNYDVSVIEAAQHLMIVELENRSYMEALEPVPGTKVAYYIEQWERSTIADVVILPHLNPQNVRQVPTKLLEKLLDLATRMLEHKPFHLITVHDEFKAHANNMNRVRYWYKEILAEIADSDVLQDLLNQIHGTNGTFSKQSSNLGDLIRQSNYALC